eukprot:1855791-Pyramimonas_sp.AAC.1
MGGATSLQDRAKIPGDVRFSIQAVLPDLSILGPAWGPRTIKNGSGPGEGVGTWGRALEKQ